MKELAQRLAALTPEQRALYELRLKQRHQRSVAAHAIPRRSADELCRQSVDQARLWFMYQLDPASPAYNVSSALRLRGELDLPTLLRALATIVERHEVLCTTFDDADGQPIQIVAPHLDVAPAQHDLRDLPPAEREQALLQLLVAQAQQPFDLRHAPPLRALLVRLDEHEHLFAVTIHHIATDWWSFNLFSRELLRLYDALVQSDPPPSLEAVVPALPIQYADFAIWQHQWLQNPALQSQLDYWKTQLAGAPPSLELSGDRARPSFQGWRGARHDLELPPTVSAGLTALCQREGVTPFMALLALFQVLLYRYTAQPDLVVGAPIANRSRAEIEPLIGFFVNTLVLRTDLAGNPTFRELLQRVRETTLQAYANQDLPFGTLVNELHVTRDTSRMPIVQIGFLTVAPDPPLHSAALAVERLDFDPGLAVFDLSLAWRERPEGPRGFFEYNTDLFDATTIARLAEHLLLLSASLINDPQQRIDEVMLLSAAEQELLHRWNATGAPYPADQTIDRLFMAQAARTPDAVALIGAGDQRMRYRELDERANQLAHQLQALGVGPDTVVALCVERSPAMAVALLGIFKAGGAYLPLDPSYPAARLQLMLDDARPPVLLTTQPLRATLLADYTPSDLAVLCLDIDAALIAAQPRTAPRHRATADNLAYLIYTSGSTGTPKGVLATHRATLNRFAWMWTAYPFGPDERGSQKTALSFADSIWELWGPLLRGVPVVIIPDEIVRDPRALIATLAAHRVTRLVLVPSLLRALLAADPALQQRLPQLRLWSVSGEALPPDVLRRFTQQLPDARLLNLYGASEIAADATCYDAAQPLTTADVPIGRPLANTTAYVLDEHLRPVPIGVPGELYIGGVGVARGYHGQPALTAERFVPDPFTREGARLYRTGDLARWLSDGSLLYLGRRDQQVKVRGYRVELGEIERAFREHPQVRQAAVSVEQFSSAAGTDQRLVAFVVGEPRTGDGEPRTENREPRTGDGELGYTNEGVREHGNDGAGTENTGTNEQRNMGEQEPGNETNRINEQGNNARADEADGSWFLVPGSSGGSSDLRAFLQQRLPGYMIPSMFVVLPALPLTPSGKLDRRALSSLTRARPESTVGFVAPRTAVEQRLAAIWGEVLDVARVGVDDHFFALGGHSLLATQVITRIRETLGIELPLRLLFESPTIATFAPHVERAQQVAVEPSLPAITPADRSGPLPLSLAQERLWFLDQLQLHMRGYHIPAAVRLSGKVDINRLERGLNRIVERHEALRTSFAQQSVETGAQPIQVIAAQLRLSLAPVDLRSLPHDQREAEARRQAQQVALHPFDLTSGPLIRAAIWQLADEHYLLLIVLHHIIADGWSLGVLVRELAALYEAEQRASTLPALPIQYADWSLWQRRWLSGSVLDRQLRYWQNHLADAPLVLDLPSDRARSAAQPFASEAPGARQAVRLPPALVAALHRLSAESDATLFMTLLATFATLLHRYTAQPDLLIGTPIAGRTRAETEPLIGFFVNTLVLRADLRGNPTFHELLQRVRETTLQAYAHQDVPFEQLVELLAPPRDTGRPPLVQVLFVLQNAPMPALPLPDLVFEPVEIETATARFDLTLELIPLQDGLVGAFEYNTDLFEAATIERMAEHFVALLGRIVDAPQQPIGALPLLSAAEQELLERWNATGAPYPADQTIDRLFTMQAARTPDAVALIARADQQRMSYRELDERANQLAHQLQALGVGPDTIVALCIERSPELIVGVLGVLKAGGAYLPLDPSYPVARLQLMLDDARPPVLLTTQPLRATLLADYTPSDLAVLCLDTDAALIDAQPRTAPRHRATADNLAYLIYTSGSTGTPKTVAIAQRGLVNHAYAVVQQADLRVGDRLLQFVSASFDAAAEEIFPALLSGATLVLPTQIVPLGLELVRFCAEHAVTLLHLPTAFWQQWIAELEPSQSPLLPTLRALMLGGDSPSADSIRAWYALLGRDLPLLHAYGPTETTISATLYNGSATQHATLPIGRPIVNVQVHLLDEYIQPIPLGAPGELYIGGVGVARGYHGQPALTAERFVPDPFTSTGARLYRTGDLARWLSDGSLLFVGRRDQQIKLRGYRIEPGEIEAALREHPAVRHAAVVLRGDGESHERRLVAYVVEEFHTELRTKNQEPGEGNTGTREHGNNGTNEPGNNAPRTDADGSQFSVLGSSVSSQFLVPGSSVGSSDLRAFLQQRLPSYMIPAAFVVLPALPLTANGKLDLRALPEPELSIGDAAVAAARTPVEEVLATIWGAVLGIERLGRDDNFFALGGHSLLATRLVAQIRAAFQVELPLRSLFVAPTIAAQAVEIERARQSETPDVPPPITPGDRSGPLPLSFMQYRIWRTEWFNPGSIAYNTPAVLRLRGALDTSALEHSLNQIIERHEALRTTFAEQIVAGERQAVQMIAPVLRLALPTHDLGALDTSARDAELEQRIVALIRQPFDLGRGPLLRCALLRLAADEHVLVLVLHHIVADGWSIGVLARELSALYTAAVTGSSAALPPLPVQYADVALWQRDWLRGPVLERLLDYWRERLAGAPPALELPTDYPRPAVFTTRGAQLQRVLSADLSQQVRALTRREGCTLYMTLLTAFKVVLAQASGQTDLVIATPIAGRTRAETEALIGIFINVLALRTSLAGDRTFRDLLRRVRETALDAYAHQDLPFALLVDALQPAPDPSRKPIAQISFNMLNVPPVQLDMPDLRAEPVATAAGGAKYELTLYAQELDGRIVLETVYNADLFAPARIAALLDHLEQLLGRVAADPSTPIGQLTPTDRST